ncbi:norbelladine synthase-like [Prosopis cineraria]|uniref:norbelladine synthase-like n=1 Tax=Prosopis cineraria TaxID=364024 RepID=UPI0024101010|nr:norbelladine synthase-like [Prosopis cineraria]
MFGSVEHELEMGVPAKETWDLFSTVRLGRFLEKEMPNLFQKVELVEGDGGLGSIFLKTIVPGKLGTGIVSCKEKVTKMDNENRIKENELIEGAYLELGFTIFKIRFEVKEKGEESSIIKTTLEYELKQEASANASLVSMAIQEAANVAQLAKLHLNQK